MRARAFSRFFRSFFNIKIYKVAHNIYLKSERAGQRVIKSITTFLKVKLRPKLYLQKSAEDISHNRKFLGFNLYHYHKHIRMRITSQGIRRFKIIIREITSRSNGPNIIKRILRINLYLRGWVGYFYLSNTLCILYKLEAGIRRKLRMCLNIAGDSLNISLPTPIGLTLALLA